MVIPQGYNALLSKYKATLKYKRIMQKLNQDYFTHKVLGKNC